MNGYAAVLLAGGAGRRMGGVDKPALEVAGRPLIERVLAAVADAAPRIVVGPPRPLPDGVLSTREEPPGAGPAAATAAGLALAPEKVPLVALLAADLPFLTAAAVRRLRDAVTRTALDTATTGGTEAGHIPDDLAFDAAGDVAVYVDRDGKRQFLCAVWRADALRDRLAASGPLPGQSLKKLYAAANVTEVSHQGDPPPWYDCDTGTDLTRAQRWLGEGSTVAGRRLDGGWETARPDWPADEAPDQAGRRQDGVTSGGQPHPADPLLRRRGGDSPHGDAGELDQYGTSRPRP